MTPLFQGLEEEYNGQSDSLELTHPVLLKLYVGACEQ